MENNVSICDVRSAAPAPPNGHDQRNAHVQSILILLSEARALLPLLFNHLLTRHLLRSDWRRDGPD